MDSSSADNANQRNPLATVRVNTQHDVADAQKIGDCLASLGRPKRQAMAVRTLLGAVILHICYKAHVLYGATGEFYEVVQFLSGREWLEGNLDEMHDYPHRADGSTHAAVRMVAATLLMRKHTERYSVVATATECIIHAASAIGRPPGKGKDATMRAQLTAAAAAAIAGGPGPAGATPPPDWVAAVEFIAAVRTLAADNGWMHRPVDGPPYGGGLSKRLRWTWATYRRGGTPAPRDNDAWTPRDDLGQRRTPPVQAGAKGLWPDFILIRPGERGMIGQYDAPPATAPISDDFKALMVANNRDPHADYEYVIWRPGDMAAVTARLTAPPSADVDIDAARKLAGEPPRADEKPYA